MSPHLCVCLFDKYEAGDVDCYPSLPPPAQNPVSPNFLSFFPPFQLCVQKLRILIEDSDQNCEPSVNACSVSFSHCLRVSGVVPILRRKQRRPRDS